MLILKSIYEEKEEIKDVLKSAKREYESFANKRNAIQIDWEHCDHIPNDGLPGLCCLKPLPRTDHLEGTTNHPEEGDACYVDPEDKRPEMQSVLQEKKEVCPERDANLPLKSRQQILVKKYNKLSSSGDHHSNPHQSQKHTIEMLIAVIREVGKVVKTILLAVIV